LGLQGEKSNACGKCGKAMDAGEMLIDHAYCKKCDYSIHSTTKDESIKMAGKGQNWHCRG
jgi:hypothetical protein